MLMAEADPNTIQKYFIAWQRKNPSFYYDIDVDKDGRLMNMLMVGIGNPAITLVILSLLTQLI